MKASDGVNAGSADFIISASASLSQTKGSAGIEITISGNGFGASKLITITCAGVQVGITTTDANGNFSGKFTVPSLATGTYKVTVSDGVNTGSADFTISTSVSLDQTTGYVGFELSVSGIGFTGKVTIKYDDVEVATTTAGANGAFSATFSVPASASGDHTITVSDNTNTIQTTFTMESEAPPVPALLLPEEDEKAKAEAYLDWKDVTDPSGVTYILQIATDEDFTKESIVLQKEALSDSEYTLTKEEELESTKKEAPYYWRVKVVDAASNESAWSTPGSFYVGFSFGLPDWAKYTLMVLGAVLIGVLGFWIGRRTAYYY